MVVARSASRLSTRRPLTNWTRSSQCEPMSPTARRSPPRSGSRRQFQSVGWLKPVLQVAAVGVPDVAEPPGADARSGLPDHRVEADVEVRAVHEPARLREPEQLARLGRRHGERLLADDVLAGGERLLDLRVMQAVRRRQVDDVDRLVPEQRFVAVVDRRDRLRGRSLRRRADDAGDRDAEPPQSVDVDDADEAGAHDTGPEIRDVRHDSSCRPGSSTSKSTSRP